MWPVADTRGIAGTDPMMHLKALPSLLLHLLQLLGVTVCACVVGQDKLIHWGAFPLSFDLEPFGALVCIF